MSTAPHSSGAASPWVLRWAYLIPAGSKVLDLACGHGRHMRSLQALGLSCLGLDRDAAALDTAQAFGEVLQADVENQPWPLRGQTFGAVVVTNYLWRPLFPAILDSLAAGGVLIYETFALGNESVGKPSNPHFLLQPGELLAVCAPLRVVAFEDGFLSEPARFVQRIVAVKAQAGSTAAPAYPLSN